MDSYSVYKDLTKVEYTGELEQLKKQVDNLANCLAKFVGLLASDCEEKDSYILIENLADNDVSALAFADLVEEYNEKG